MKKTIRKVQRVFTIVLLASWVLPIQAALVWNNAGAGSNFATAGNYVGGVAPVSGVDSVQFDTAAGTSFISSEFTIANGQSFTSTGDGVPIRVGAGADLTLETGGTIDFLTGGNGILAESANNSSNNAMLTFEPGASASVNQYFEAPGWSTTFIADAAGVTTFEVTGLIGIRDSTLTVDLTNYDFSNGDLVLFDYGTRFIRTSDGTTGEYSTVNIIGGPPSAFIDYEFDIDGNGDLGIAIVIPEPTTLGLLLGFIFAGLVGYRPRRA